MIFFPSAYYWLKRQWWNRGARCNAQNWAVLFGRHFHCLPVSRLWHRKLVYNIESTILQMDDDPLPRCMLLLHPQIQILDPSLLIKGNQGRQTMDAILWQPLERVTYTYFMCMNVYKKVGFIYIIYAYHKYSIFRIMGEVLSSWIFMIL